MIHIYKHSSKFVSMVCILSFLFVITGPTVIASKPQACASQYWDGKFNTDEYLIVIQYIWHDTQPAPEIHVFIIDKETGEQVAHYWWHDWVKVMID